MREWRRRTTGKRARKSRSDIGGVNTVLDCILLVDGCILYQECIGLECCQIARYVAAMYIRTCDEWTVGDVISDCIT